MSRTSLDMNPALARMIGKEEYLSKGDELELLQQAQDKNLPEKIRDKAVERIINSHLRLALKHAHAFAHFYKGAMITKEDLFQEATIGMGRAIETFDESFDTRFSTYATWYIKVAMQEFLRKNRHIVKFGSSAEAKKIGNNYVKLKNNIMHQHPHIHRDEMLKIMATTLGVQLWMIRAMQYILEYTPTSMNMPIGNDEGNSEFGEFIEDTSPRPDQIVEEQLDEEKTKAKLNLALESLRPREQYIIRARYLAKDGEESTLQSLGDAMGVSKERVRQIEEKGLKKLKRYFQFHRR